MSKSHSELPEPIYRIRELQRITGYKPATIWEKVRDGDFPPPIKLGVKASGWLASDIAAWQRERIEATKQIRVQAAAAEKEAA